MTTNLSDILHLLLGAALVAIGVLAGAAADRIRGLRVAQRAARDPIDRVERRSPTPPRGAPIPTTTAHTAMARDVVATLVTAGYGKIEAQRAVVACPGSQCATIESWTRAALRKIADAKRAAS